MINLVVSDRRRESRLMPVDASAMIPLEFRDSFQADPAI